MATIWPGFLAFEQTTEAATDAGCRPWVIFIVTGCMTLLVWASGIVTKRGRNRILKEVRVPGPTPPAKDRKLWP